jgi:3-methyladenine DNA glycosylase AlkD
MLQQIIAEIQSHANPQKAQILQRFFKTGKGEYGEGDIFLGIVVPIQRRIAKQFTKLSLTDVSSLLHSPIHEYRLIALLIMVLQFEKGNEAVRKDLFDLYLAHTKRINNWDLVDLSAPNIVGEYLQGKDITTLKKLSTSPVVWERRIAMLATFADIKRGRFNRALTIATMLVHDSHDLIQKAVGWMLREMGKRDGLQEEEDFLQKYAGTMPRTMLRYAIERFPTQKRMHYLHLKSVT